MDFVIAKLLGFAMILSRISAFFLVSPVFSWKSIPVRIKVSITIMLSIFFSMIKGSSINSAGVNELEAILLLSNEILYGLALGLIVSLLFAVVKFCGRIVERQMGLAMAEVLDPLTGERGQPLGMLMEMIFIVLILNANVHHLFLLAISRSFEVFPVGQTPSIEILTGGVVEAGSALMIAGLRLSAPILVTFIVLLVILAVLARIAPEMNILFVSLPVRVGLGLLMVGVYFTFINDFVSEFVDWMNKLLPV